MVWLAVVAQLDIDEWLNSAVDCHTFGTRHSNKDNADTESTCLLYFNAYACIMPHTHHNQSFQGHRLLNDTKYNHC